MRNAFNKLSLVLIIWFLSVSSSVGVLYGTEVYGETQAALQAAINAVKSENAILRLSSNKWLITSDLPIPSNITLRVEKGAVLSIIKGATLTINGTFEAGSYQVFSCDGTGKVVFGPGSVDAIRPEWGNAAGTGSAAMQCAIDTAAVSTCKKVKLTGSAYTFDAPIDLTSGTGIDRSGMVIEGSGRRAGTTIYANTGGICFELTGSSWTSWNGLYVKNGLTNPSTVGFFLAGTANKPESQHHNFTEVYTELYKANINNLVYGTVGFMVVGSEENNWIATQTHATTPALLTTTYAHVSKEYPSYFRASEVQATHSCGANTFVGENSLITFDKKGSNLVLYAANSLDLGNIYLANVNVGTPGTNCNFIKVLGGTLDGMRGRLKVEVKDTLEILAGEIMGWDLAITYGGGTKAANPVVLWHIDAGSTNRFQDFRLHLTYVPGIKADFNGKKFIDTTGTQTIMPKINNIDITVNQDYANYGAAPFPAWFCGIARNVNIKWNDASYYLNAGQHRLVLPNDQIYLGTGNTAKPTNIAKIYLPAIAAGHSARTIAVRAKGILTDLHGEYQGNEANVTGCMFDISRGAYSTNDGNMVIGSPGTVSDDLLPNKTVTALSNNPGSFLFTGVDLNMLYNAGNRTIQLTALPLGSGGGLGGVLAFIQGVELEMQTRGRAQELIYLQ